MYAHGELDLGRGKFNKSKDGTFSLANDKDFFVSVIGTPKPAM
jgi:hypothetical protein